MPASTLPLPIDLDGPTVTSFLAQNPSVAPKSAAAKLFPKPWLLARIFLRVSIKDNLYHRAEPSAEQVELAFRSGKWSSDPASPRRPSDLFLKIYADVLLCLQRDKLSGLVSPPLIGTCGVMPLTILSVIPDIMQHYYDCIVLAKREVLLATNYLQKSDSQRTICDALRELSRRVGARNQTEKVVVKLIYDRGNWRQVFKHHQPVRPNTSAWKAVGLPNLDEIPNLELEVINFHRVILGTFHAKFLVIDRTVALLNSNNIQDRPNMEMMIHLEGPIVDAFYDMFLISWSNAFAVPLPFLSSPTSSHLALTSSPSASSTRQYRFGFDNPFLRSIDVVRSAQDARATLNREAESDRNAQQQQLFEMGGGGMGSGLAAVVRDIMEERKRFKTPSDHSTPTGSTPATILQPREDLQHQRPLFVSATSARFTNAVQHLIEERRKAKALSTAPTPAPVTTPNIGNSLVAPAREIKTSGDSLTTTFVSSGCSSSGPAPTITPASFPFTPPIKSGPDDPVKARKVSIRSVPLNNAEDLQKRQQHRRLGSHESAASSCTNTNGCSQRTESKAGKNRMRALSDALASTLRRAQANVSADHPISDFQPHTIHTPHDEFPIIMVNRPGHGFPGHNDIRTPQNAAWLAGFKYAKTKVFIQTPTLNAKPVVRMCIDTALRGVLVVLYLDLGFNDKGESIPFQGGTNQEVVIRMYRKLAKFNKQKFLRVYWYTGKDQIRPINAVLKSLKFMAIDDEVGIQGNGNQDTQSWFHSQEVNVMIDSKTMVGEWMHALISNQNTELYGRVELDGIWRDEAGHTVDYYDQVNMSKRKKGLNEKVASDQATEEELVASAAEEPVAVSTPVMNVVDMDANAGDEADEIERAPIASETGNEKDTSMNPNCKILNHSESNQVVHRDIDDFGNDADPKKKAANNVLHEHHPAEGSGL